MVASTKILSFRIATLKGLKPSAYLTSPNNTVPTFGNKGTIEARGSVMEYPQGINDTLSFGVIKRKQVKLFEWRLPKGWQISGESRNSDGTYHTANLNVKIITDYFSQGEISVRGVNDIQSAYSDTYNFGIDKTRGLHVLKAPDKIVFGQNTTYTYQVTSFPDVTYKWEAPPGWKINGEGNTASGVNLHSITVTPSFCSTNDTVRLSFQKETEISDWHVLPGRFSGKPEIKITNEDPGYQYEQQALTLGVPDNSSIQNVTWYGEGIEIISGQGTQTPSIIFTKTDTTTIKANLQMKGCSNIDTLSKKIVIKPHRLSIMGPTKICDEGTFSIKNFNYLPPNTTVKWSAGNNFLTLVSQQGGTAVFRKNGNGVSLIKATINNSSIVSLQDINVGAPNMGKMEVVKSGNDGKLCVDRPNEFSVTYDGDFKFFNEEVIEYEWRVSDGWIIEEHPSAILFEVHPRMFAILLRAQSPHIYGYVYVSVRARNACGWSDWIPSIPYTTETCRGCSIYIYPNPATSYAIIDLSQNSSTTISTQGVSKNTGGNVTQIQLWSASALLKSYQTTEPTYQISVEDLPKGIYFVVVIKDGKRYSQKLIKK